MGNLPSFIVRSLRAPRRALARRGLVGMTGLFLSTELRAPLRSTALFLFCHFDFSPPPCLFDQARLKAERVEKSRSVSDGQKGVDRSFIVRFLDCARNDKGGISTEPLLSFRLLSFCHFDFSPPPLSFRPSEAESRARGEIPERKRRTKGRRPKLYC